MHEYIFETPRLRAHRLGPEDVDALHAVYGDADAMRWVLLKAGMQRGALRANDDGSFTQLFAWTP